MAEPFVGEIEIFAFGVVPQGWVQCNGQSLLIQQNAALYSLIGKTFGGDATTFNVPDLRGAVPVGQGAGAGLTARTMGNKGGEAAHPLTLNEIPTHTHSLNAVAPTGTGNVAVPGVTTILTQTTGTDGTGAPATYNLYAADAAPNQALLATAVIPAGTGTAHNNMMPSLALNFCIAVQGLYPPRPS